MGKGDDEDSDVRRGEDLPIDKFVDVLLRDAGYEVMPRRGVSFVRDGDVGGGGANQEGGGGGLPQQASEEGGNLG